jgi:hypothetical protein
LRPARLAAIISALMNSASLRSGVAVFLLGLFATLSAQADPNLGFTAFAGADLAPLADGKVLQARGGLIDFERGVTAQSLYFIAAPPQTVEDKLSTWNPASHSDLQVWLHRSLPPHPTANDFSGLADLPDNISVNNMISATFSYTAGSDSLQLNPAEAQRVIAAQAQGKSKAAVVAIWSQLLAGRAADYLSGSLADAQYKSNTALILPLAEARSLLHSDPKIFAEFHPLLAGTPMFNQHKTSPFALYYECFDIENTAALGTGALYHAVSPQTIEHADVEYFVSSGIYTSVELEQLWPVTIGGKAGTLVWRTDMVSTVNVAYLHGTERLASGMLMLQDVKQAIDAFRSEFH